MPSVVVPILPWADQAYWGATVEKMGIGERVDKAAVFAHGVAPVQRALRRCLCEQTQDRCAHIKMKLEQEQCGAKVAARAIMEALG